VCIYMIRCIYVYVYLDFSQIYMFMINETQIFVLWLSERERL
jgi:hypothetical protein